MTTLVELVLQELEETEPANVNIEPPLMIEGIKQKLRFERPIKH